jgi:beta-glucosidase/6-phospho-beta-glucosidase/beta-galactosidase
LVSKVPNYPIESNFSMKKVKNRGMFLITTCLHGTSMGESSPKGSISHYHSPGSGSAKKILKEKVDFLGINFFQKKVFGR